MTTPPRPTPDDLDAALRRIHERRRRAGDDHPLALSEDPRDVLRYLRQRGSAGLVADNAGDDLTDALTLTLGLWWEHLEFETWLLQAGEKLGRNRRTVGAVLGLTHGQSLVDRIGRGLKTLGRGPIASSAPAPTGHDPQIRALADALITRSGEMPQDVVDDTPFRQLADALERWPAGGPPPSEGVALALKFVLGDLDDELAADAPLRDLVTAGIDLVGARHTTVTVTIP